MSKYVDEAKREELLAKKKYYREHPEEAKKEYAKRDDGHMKIGDCYIGENKKE